MFDLYEAGKISKTVMDVLTDEGNIRILRTIAEAARSDSQTVAGKEAGSPDPFLSKPNSHGQTALMLAAKNG